MVIPNSIEQKWHDYRTALKKIAREKTIDDTVSDGIEMAGWRVEEATEMYKKDASTQPHKHNKTETKGSRNSNRSTDTTGPRLRRTQVSYIHKNPPNNRHHTQSSQSPAWMGLADWKGRETLDGQGSSPRQFSKTETRSRASDS